MNSMEPIFNLINIMSAKNVKSKNLLYRDVQNSPTSAQNTQLTDQNALKRNREIYLSESESLREAKDEGCGLDCNYIQTPRRKNEVHIEHRKCKQRKCSVCKPVLKNYHSLHSELDPVLFTRWEKKINSNSTTLMKVHYKINVGIENFFQTLLG